MSERKATLIYLKNEVLLSKKLYYRWEECQNDYYSEYKTNMSPMTMEEIVIFFTQDWGLDDTKWPFTKKDISYFYENEVNLLCLNK